MKCIILIFLGSVMLFTTCKKYPEGGFIKRGPKNILGQWKLTLYEVNGIDSTDLINYNNDENYKRINFLKNASTISISAPYSGAKTIDFIEKNQKIKFGNPDTAQGKECILYQNINYCYRSFLIPEGTKTATWSIDQLDKKLLKISMTTKNSYEIILSNE